MRNTIILYGLFTVTMVSYETHTSFAHCQTHDFWKKQYSHFSTLQFLLMTFYLKQYISSNTHLPFILSIMANERRILQRREHHAD